MPLGIAVLVVSSDVVEYRETYSHCRTPECYVTFSVSETMESPVFLYYELTNMFRNHRLYLKSRSDEQLAGDDLGESEISEYCEAVQENKDVWAFPNSRLYATEQDAVANPCGLVANSLFNDTFEFVGVEMKRHGISWYEDQERYKRLDNWIDKQWTDVEKEDFSVWMRVAATSTNKKLYGIIEKTLEKGNYTVKIENRYTDVRRWDGEKRLILSTSSAFGGKNKLLGGLLVAVACIALLELVIILVFFRHPNNSCYFQDFDAPIPRGSGVITKPDCESPVEGQALAPI